LQARPTTAVFEPLADWGDALGVGRTREGVWRHGRGSALNGLPEGKTEWLPPSRDGPCRGVKSQAGWHDRRGGGAGHRRIATVAEGAARGLFGDRAWLPQHAAPEKASGPCARTARVRRSWWSRIVQQHW